MTPKELAIMVVPDSKEKVQLIPLGIFKIDGHVIESLAFSKFFCATSSLQYVGKSNCKYPLTGIEFVGVIDTFILSDDDTIPFDII